MDWVCRGDRTQVGLVKVGIDVAHKVCNQVAGKRQTWQVLCALCISMRLLFWWLVN